MKKLDRKPLEVTSYEVLGKLPDLFTFENGEKVKTPSDWKKRRKELYKTAVELQYGTLPPKPEILEVETLYIGAIHRSYKIHTGTKEKPISFYMKVLMPKGADKCPFIITGDLCFPYAFDQEYLSPALNEGIGWVLFDRTELAHDNWGQGRREGALYGVYPEYSFGSVGAWAWGYSRCVDALLKLGIVDPDYIVFTGHSRGGKTAMLAGVTDERASIVNPNETCQGLASCYRVHMTADNERSERLEDLMTNFPFWMGEGMLDYMGRAEELPFDAHFLKAMVAPRTLFVSEAVDDIWANPLGSYQTTMAAKEAFKFLDVEENLFWYFRDGFHAHKPQDIQMLVNLIKHKKDGTPLHEDFERAPFEIPDPIY